MLDTFLNPIEIKIGTIVRLTERYIKDNKRLCRLVPEFSVGAEFEVVETRQAMAEDYLTELREETTFVTKLKDLKSGKVFDVNEVDKLYQEAHGDSLYAALFTSETPDWVSITNKFTLGK